MTESNMIMLRADASVPSVNLVFNDTMVLGRQKDALFLNASSNYENNIFTFSRASNVLQTPTVIANNFSVRSNASFESSMYVSNVLYTNTLSTAAVSIDVPTQGQNEYLNVQKNNELYWRITSATNDMTYNGRIGIGTNPAYALHTIGDAAITNNVRTSNIVTRSIGDVASPNKIVMNDILQTNAGTIVNCIKLPNTSLFVEGEFRATNINFTASSFRTISVTDNASLANIVCSNMSNLTTPPHPALTLVHNSNYGVCNVIDGYVNGRPVISLDTKGRLSLGSKGTSRGMLDIIHTASNTTSNMIAISGVTEHDLFFVDENANVGIGTTLPLHHFHVVRNEDQITNTAFIGLYDNTVADEVLNKGYGAFLTAHNVTGRPVTTLDKYGQLTLGEIDYSSNWTLNVQSNMRVPYIQTSYIAASPSFGNCNLDFQGSAFCNVQQITTSNITVQNLALTCNLTTSWFYAESFLIKGLELINTNVASNLKITSDRFVFTGTGVCFGPESAAQTTPALEGKLKVTTIESPDVNFASVGVNVVGPTRNSIRVTSGSPSLELIRTTGTQSEVYMGVDSTGFFMSYGNVSGAVTSPIIYSSSAFRMFNMSSSGVRLADKVQVTSDGRMFINNPGINFASPTYNTQKLFVKGNTQFVTNDVAEMPVLHINDQSPARVGIATASPLSTLHVHGGVTVTSGANIDLRNPVNVGIATAPASLTVQSNITVHGTMTVTGDITYKGATLLNSLWSTNGTNATTLSSVGIGTASPTSNLHVHGGVLLTSPTNTRFINVNSGFVGFGTFPRQALDLVGSNMIINNGRLGIGTITPLAPLHVTGASYFNGNVGIGVINPAFELDIQGNINFSGALYQNSLLYVSSQWTTVNTSNLWYSGSNVGLGTDNPVYKFQVERGDAFFGSNVTVAGILNAQRSVSTRSDARVKTDLRRIEDAAEIVGALTGYKYKRTDIGTAECGLLAQEVQSVLPELVQESSDGMLNVNYGNMAAVFVEAIKGLQQEVKELREEVAILRSKC
jgi:hypothetical protein